MRKFKDLTNLSQRGTLHKTHTGQFIWLLWLIIMKLIQKSLPGLSQGKQYLHAVYTRGDHSELRVKKRMKNKIDSFFSLTPPHSLLWIDVESFPPDKNIVVVFARPPHSRRRSGHGYCLNVGIFLWANRSPILSSMSLSLSILNGCSTFFIRSLLLHNLHTHSDTFFQISLVCHITRIPATCLQHHELYMIISSLKSSQTAWP